MLSVVMRGKNGVIGKFMVIVYGHMVLKGYATYLGNKGWSKSYARWIRTVALEYIIVGDKFSHSISLVTYSKFLFQNILLTKLKLKRKGLHELRSTKYSFYGFNSEQKSSAISEYHTGCI